MIELPPLDAALDNVLELARVIPGSGFVRHIKMGLNDIVHIPQQQRRPLLDVVGSTEIQLSGPAFHDGADRPGGESGLHLIAPQIGQPDRRAHVDAVDHPPQPRMPVNCLDQPPGCRRGHDIIADPFHLHLRSGEEGVVPPDLQRDGHQHALLSFVCGRVEQRTAP